jgi:hypothetical protein
MCAAGRACIPATDSCAEAACTTSCQDARQVCAPDILACYLPPATCTETDEPNDNLSSAIVVSNNHYAGVLCRGDVDYLRVAGHAGKQLRVAIGVAGTDRNIDVELRDSDGAVAASRPVATSETNLHTVVNADANYYVVVRGTGTLVDSWNYTIDVTEPLPPTACVNEPGEPNETQAAASNSVLATGASMRGLCTSNDQDWHQITAPAQRQLVVSTTWDHGDGGLDISLLAGGQTFTTYETETGLVAYKYSNRGSDPTSTYLHVMPVGGISDEPFAYTVVVSDQPLPVCADSFEPNETIQTAEPITAGTFNGAICDNTDKDFFRVQLTRAGAINATLDFASNEADLDMFLLRPDGTPIDSAVSSSSPERVNGTNLAAGRYLIEVRRYSLRAELVVYSLMVTTPDEPLPDAGTRDSGVADTGAVDTGTADTGTADIGAVDIGVVDVSATDAAHDAGIEDAGSADH